MTELLKENLYGRAKTREKRSSGSCGNTATSAVVWGAGRPAHPRFFFFQAEDGIRDRNVTGVQTCALPISPLTKDLHHEVERIVAMKSGGLNIPADKALDHVYGYAVGIDLTRRDLQLASRKKERPWEVGKSFDHSAPCSAIQPASKIGHPANGKIWLTVNGKETQQ